MRSLSCALLVVLGFSAFLSCDAAKCFGRYQLVMGRLMPCGPPQPVSVVPVQPLVVMPTLPFVANDMGMDSFNDMAQEAGMINTMMTNQLTLFGPMTMGEVEDGSMMTNSHLVPGCHMSETFEDNLVLATLAESTVRINIYGDRDTALAAMQPDCPPPCQPAVAALLLRQKREAEDNSDNSVVTCNCVPLMSVDTLASNGVIHALEGMMAPVTKSVNEILAEQFPTFAKALETSQLSSVLNGDGPFTIFAPSEEAFAALGEINVEALLKTPRCLVSVVENHLSDGAVCSAGFANVSSVENLLGKSIVLGDAGVSVDGAAAEFSSRDIVGTNGIIHVISSVLMPPEAQNVVDKALEAGADAAVGLAVEAGLESLLKGTDEITVLMPSNEAIEKLPESIRARMAEDKDFLAQVLSYHVIPGELAATDLIDGSHLPTLNPGKNISVIDFQAAPESEDVVKTAQCAPVSDNTDIQGCNGVVHIIDQVMIPPVGNLMEQLDSDPKFSTLAGLLRTAGLDLILQGPGSYTIFAPSNAAFESLDEFTMQCLNNYPELLRNVLMYHITAGSLCCAGMHKVDMNANLASLAGCNYNVCEVEGVIAVDSASIKQCDITSTNGVIHEVDCVLPGALQRFVMAFTARPLLMGLYLGY